MAKEKKYHLLYASIDCEDDLFVDYLGTYPTLNEAEKAMLSQVNCDVADGDEEKYWKIKGIIANYDDPFSFTNKQYKIVEVEEK